MSQVLLAEGAAQLLHLRRKEIEDLVRNGQIPHIVLPNGDIRFIDSHLWGWLTNIAKFPAGESPRLPVCQ